MSSVAESKVKSPKILSYFNPSRKNAKSKKLVKIEATARPVEPTPKQEIKNENTPPPPQIQEKVTPVKVITEKVTPTDNLLFPSPEKTTPNKKPEAAPEPVEEATVSEEQPPTATTEKRKSKPMTPRVFAQVFKKSTKKKTDTESKLKKEVDDEDYKPPIKPEKKKKSSSSKKSKKKEPKIDVKQPLITNFIRRSRRVPAAEKRKQEQVHLRNYLAVGNDAKLEHIVMRDTDGKGRGIFATKDLPKGEFVVEYAGDLVDLDEGKRREEEYGLDAEIGCYIYFFSFQGKRYCIDATAESGRYGRLLNHSKTKANCKTRLVEEPEGIPRLIIEAKVDIKEDDELLYDYGDRSSKACEAHPWLKQ